MSKLEKELENQLGYGAKVVSETHFMNWNFDRL
jgi:hypothetical protein